MTPEHQDQFIVMDCVARDGALPLLECFEISSLPPCVQEWLSLQKSSNIGKFRWNHVRPHTDLSKGGFTDFQLQSPFGSPSKDFHFDKENGALVSCILDCVLDDFLGLKKNTCPCEKQNQPWLKPKLEKAAWAHKRTSEVFSVKWKKEEAREYSSQEADYKIVKLVFYMVATALGVGDAESSTSRLLSLKEYEEKLKNYLSCVN